MLGAIQFSDAAVLWAQGFTPPGAAGEGEWTLLTSRDAGRSWRELRKSWSHNAETKAFFAGRRDGWIAVPNGFGAEPYYASTADGGRRWQPIHVPSDFVVQVIYRGGGRGAAFANDQYSRKSVFFVTRDNGQHWRSTRIGGDMWVDAFAYSGSNTPVLAGCADHETTILASPDGGRNWLRTKIPQISATPETVGCEAGVDGFAFPPDEPGFALVQRHSFPLTKTDGYASLWRTRDGGAHWTRVYFEGYPSDGPQAKWFTGPYALGDLTLVFVRTGTSGSVLYSRNEGESWSRAPADTAFRLFHPATLPNLHCWLKRVPYRDVDHGHSSERPLDRFRYLASAFHPLQTSAASVEQPCEITRPQALSLMASAKRSGTDREHVGGLRQVQESRSHRIAYGHCALGAAYDFG